MPRPRAALERPGLGTQAVPQHVYLSDLVNAAPAAWTGIRPDATSVPPLGAPSLDIVAMLVFLDDFNQIVRPQRRRELKSTRVDMYGW